jgi:hypothetical protein
MQHSYLSHTSATPPRCALLQAAAAQPGSNSRAAAGRLFDREAENQHEELLLVAQLAARYEEGDWRENKVDLVILC